MRQNFLKYVLSAALFALALVPMMAAAQQLPDTNVRSPQSLIGLLCYLAGWMFTLLVVLAVIFVIYAAFMYLTAAGDPGKVGKASSMLIYAAVAVAVAIFAKAFPLIIGGFFTSAQIQGC